MQLLEVQKKALKSGYDKSGFAYYMEMGLGKTLVALTEFMQLVSEKKATRMVVFCPNSFKGGWVDEIKKHNIDVHYHIFESGADWENDKFLKLKYTKPPILIINYEAIRKENVQAYIRMFAANRKCMLTIDESVQIKTYDSLQTKAALALSTLFQYVRLLSGKPVTQGPHDLWAQMRAINAIGHKYYPFKTTFCRMGGFKGKKVVGTQNEELLASLIDKFIFRANKKDWTDLPEKLYTSREYQLSPTLKRHYLNMENEFVVWLNEEENVTVDAFITKYIKLAQIQSGFIIKDDGKVEELVPSKDNPRFNLLKEIISEVEGKVIIPYVHRYTLNMLMESLAEFQPTYIKGGMEAHEIQVQKDSFNGVNSRRIMLVQIRAGKYGHTLLGDQSDITNSCNTMIFAENSYSLDDRSQIEDRMHRHGQKRACLYIDLWGTPLDRKVTKALQDKESIAQAVFQFFGKRSSLV